ncbi:hypothetical protein ACWGIB_10850 [Streptomyces xiamenensis]
MSRKPKMSDDERRAYSAMMRAELEAIMDGAYSAMVTSEEFWTTVLRTAAILADRSPVNSIAIAAQCPHATRVHGAGDWRKVGRYPAKGSSAIRIWMPMTRRAEIDPAPAASVDGGQFAEAGDTVTDGGGSRVSGFKAGPVFDISQTDGDAYELPAVPFSAQVIWAALADQQHESDVSPGSPGEYDYAVRLHLYSAASRHISEAEALVFGQREAEISSAAHVAALILGVAPGRAVMPPLAGIVTQDKKPPVHGSAVRVIETGRAIAQAVAAAVERPRELTSAG